MTDDDSTKETPTLTRRALTWLRATRERYPDGISSPELAEQLELDPNAAAAVLSKLHDLRCLTREKTNGARGGRLMYRYRYVTDVIQEKPVETREKPRSGHAKVSDMLILMPLGRETIQVNVEDARALWRHLCMIFGRAK